MSETPAANRWLPLVSAPLAGLMFDTFGNYRGAFFGASVLLTITLVALLATKNPLAKTAAA